MARLAAALSITAAFAVIAALGGNRVAAQNAPALVIQGGTLIDGNGGAPVANAVVVIQGNRIAAAGPAGQVQVPAGARVINAAGKYVLPGLWDGQTNYSWFNGELNLNQGVTSVMDIGNGEEWSLVHREGVAHRGGRRTRSRRGLSKSA